jgi:hypothetical protein
MKKITDILQEKNVKVNSLPENIQSAIENSINLFDDIQNLEATLTDESTDEEKAEFVEMKDTHEEFNESIVGAIENFQKETEVKKKAEKKNEERQKAREAALKKLEEDAKKPEAERRPPEFGSEKDFQLNQALNQLKGLPVKVSTTLAECKDAKKDK